MGGTPSCRQAVRSLGIFHNDDASDGPWMLTFDDPHVLAQINSVFVTLESAKKPIREPRGRRILFAFLGTKPASFPALKPRHVLTKPITSRGQQNQESHEARSSHSLIDSARWRARNRAEFVDGAAQLSAAPPCCLSGAVSAPRFVMNSAAGRVAAAL